MRRSSYAWLAVGVCLVGSPLGAQSEHPQPVSPGAATVSEHLGTSCPTFSWSGIREATGYELVVYRVTENGELEPEFRVEVPGDARAWTPSASQCPRSSSSYAWAVRAQSAKGSGHWSEALLFETARTPSEDEVRRSLQVLRRYAEMSRDQREVGDTEQSPARAGSRALQEFREQELRPGLRAIRRELHRSASSPRTIEASAPALGNASITISEQLHLADASALFTNDQLFLWDDTSGNLALGRNALASATGYATNNTAVGREALRNTLQTTYGIFDYGSYNTGVGDRALFSNTEGSGNTATGYRAHYSNTTGDFNTAVGHLALYDNTDGNWNVAIGDEALVHNIDGERNTAIGTYAGGYATTGSDNIFLGSGAYGVAGESNTIRIGGSMGTGPGQQNRTFIAGIHGAAVDGASDLTVLVDNDGKLGTSTSSRRFKEEISDLGEASARILQLRPVSFRFTEQDGEGPHQYGLIAEEVAEVFPELVVDDEEGRPFGVRYRVLIPLLLNELQRQQEELGVQRRKLQSQREQLEAVLRRLAALEEGRPPGV